MTTSPPPAEPRIPQLDGLRALAILMVLIEHAIRPPLFWVGVDIFFVLSGFLITGLLLQRKTRHTGDARGFFSGFYLRRAFRILPPYLVALTFGALVFGAAYLHRYWPYFAFFGMNLYECIHPLGVMPLPLWSLAVEEQFYFVWPLVLFLLPERHLLRVALAVLLLDPLLRALATPLFQSPAPIYFLTPFRADLFCAGAALSLFWRNHRSRTERLGRRFAPWGTFAGFAAMGLTQLSPHLRWVANTRASNALLYSLSLIGCSCLLLWTLTGRGLLYPCLTLAPVRYLGRISYTVYLVHLCFYEPLRRYTSNQYLVLVAGSAATIAFSALSWHLLEQPLIRLSHRLTPTDRLTGPSAPPALHSS